MTSATCLALGERDGTSKVSALPRPMTGSFSPVFGMVRTIFGSDFSAANRHECPSGRKTPAAAAPISFAACRRESFSCILCQTHAVEADACGTKPLVYLTRPVDPARKSEKQIEQ